MPPYEIDLGRYRISTDPLRIDLPTVQSYLHDEGYWSRGIPPDVVERALQNSLCFGVYEDRSMVGFARIVSDYATYAYLCDVFILPEFRGRGLSKHLLGAILTHPSLQGLRRWHLVTRDAQGLYAQFGFQEIGEGGRHMEKVIPPWVIYGEVPKPS